MTIWTWVFSVFFVLPLICDLLSLLLVKFGIPREIMCIVLTNRSNALQMSKKEIYIIIDV